MLYWFLLKGTRNFSEYSSHQWNVRLWFVYYHSLEEISDSNLHQKQTNFSVGFKTSTVTFEFSQEDNKQIWRKHGCYSFQRIWSKTKASSKELWQLFEITVPLILADDYQYYKICVNQWLHQRKKNWNLKFGEMRIVPLNFHGLQYHRSINCIILGCKPCYNLRYYTTNQNCSYIRRQKKIVAVMTGSTV